MHNLLSFMCNNMTESNSMRTVARHSLTLAWCRRFVGLRSVSLYSLFSLFEVIAIILAVIGFQLTSSLDVDHITFYAERTTGL